jgi:hypothetical protein
VGVDRAADAEMEAVAAGGGGRPRVHGRDTRGPSERCSPKALRDRYPSYATRWCRLMYWEHEWVLEAAWNFVAHTANGGNEMRLRADESRGYTATVDSSHG